MMPSLFRLCLFLLLATSFSIHAQPAATPAEQRILGFEQRKALKNKSLLSELNPTNIGPSVFSCRVTDVDVNPANPAEFYVAYASAGLWHTNSNGTQFKPLFDHEAAI